MNSLERGYKAKFRGTEIHQADIKATVATKGDFCCLTSPSSAQKVRQEDTTTNCQLLRTIPAGGTCVYSSFKRESRRKLQICKL